ncbi:STAS domain-containing protein [Kitasatospora sp. NPDC001660]
MLPCLNSETVRVGHALVCSFAGDMILDSEPVAVRALNAALDQRPALLAVDLAGVELFTSTGLNLLLTARRRAMAEGVTLVLVGPSQQTLRVLELTETAVLFVVCATAEDALLNHPPRRPPVWGHGPGAPLGSRPGTRAPEQHLGSPCTPPPTAE